MSSRLDFLPLVPHSNVMRPEKKSRCLGSRMLPFSQEVVSVLYQSILFVLGEGDDFFRACISKLLLKRDQVGVSVGQSVPSGRYDVLRRDPALVQERFRRVDDEI